MAILGYFQEIGSVQRVIDYMIERVNMLEGDLGEILSS